MQNKICEIIKFQNSPKRVWIGDPCYVISDKLWDTVCEQIFKGRDSEVGQIITFNFKQMIEANCLKADSPHEDEDQWSFIQCGTMYGDGLYESNTGFRYGVDSGCLGIVPDYLIAPENLADAKRLGQFFELDKIESMSLITDGKGEFLFSVNESTIEMIFTGDEEEYEEDKAE